MALIPCPDCGREVSDAAAACPQCGRPIARPFAPADAYAPAQAYAPSDAYSTAHAYSPPAAAGAAPRYAGFGPRLLASLVDFAVIVIPQVLIFLAYAQSGAAAYVLGRFAAGAVLHGYEILPVALWGQTLGKRAARIQIRRADGRPVGLGGAILRDLVPLLVTGMQLLAVLIAAAALPGSVAELTGSAARQTIRGAMPGWNETLSLVSAGFFIVDALVFFCNDRRRALHDYIAGTVVVHVE